MNACTGVVGVFNLQGSSWDRSRRRFHIHNSTPPELATTVRPTDVEPFRALLEAAGCSLAPSPPANGVAPQGNGAGSASGTAAGGAAANIGSSGDGSDQGGSGAAASGATAAAAAPGELDCQLPDFAVFVGSSGELHRVAWDGGVQVTAKGECHTRVTDLQHVYPQPCVIAQ